MIGRRPENKDCSRTMGTLIRNKIPGLLSLGLFTLFWQLASSMEWVRAPGPACVLAVFCRLVTHGDPVVGLTLPEMVLTSLSLVIKGALAGFALALPLGLLMGLNSGVERFFQPLAAIFRPIPPLAWIPMAYVIFAGFRQPTVWVQGFVVFVGAFFPALLSTVEGVKRVDPLLAEAARTMGASSATVIFRVILPAAAPSVVTGVRVGLGVAWMCLVAAEFVGGRTGIGNYIWTVYSIGGKAAEIMAGMAAIGLVAVFFDRAADCLGRRFVPWRW